MARRPDGSNRMSVDELKTRSLHAMVARHQEGDIRAMDDLIRRTADRLERIASKMLNNFPAVKSREQTGDVLQNALIRLTRALEKVTPNSVREFYALATEQLRRELLDLARRHRKRAVTEGNTGSLPNDDSSQENDRNPADRNLITPEELDRWHDVQVAVEKLPVHLREVFGLTFYHGWTQVQIAELLAVTDRQVRRWWAEACLKLQAAIGGDTLPTP
ncbi:RNA polymerase sigma factor [Zavarzinella formosa]|uniref:RNA polymerase sigma factor n=1 Tax=Zavarzinella formosa TaxID=360055 RepID=UPI0012FC2E6C|nr:sigma-70 family RNA polymerase sigma factor [Zavarzinella formosa]